MGFIQSSDDKPASGVHEFNVWLIFLLLSCAFACISYGSFPFGLESSILLIAFFPLLNAFIATPAQSAPPLQDPFPNLPTTLWLILIPGAVLIRLVRLTTLSAWPMPDEAFSGFFSLQLYEGARPVFLYGWFQGLPLHQWLLGFFFHLSKPSLTSLYLYPALLSMVGLAAAWYAARSVWKEGSAALYFILAAFSFWPLYIGRFCFGQGLLLILEWLILGLGLRFFRADEKNLSPRHTVYLAVCLAAGFYLSHAWPAVVLGLMLLTASIPRPKNGFPLLRLLALAFLLASPMLLAMTTHPYLGFIGSLLFNPGKPLDLFVIDWPDAFSTLFWKSPHPNIYGPLWGGMLNPIADALALVGMLELWRFHRRQAVWIFAVVLILFTPELAAHWTDTFRSVQLLPFLFFFIVLGFIALRRKAPGTLGLAVLSAVLLFSVILDTHHLFDVYQQKWGKPGIVWDSIKSRTEPVIYQALKTQAEHRGPGCILYDFDGLQPSAALRVALYPFNAARNRSLSNSRPLWVAWVANKRFGPYLSKRFPEGRLVRLPSRNVGMDAGPLLFILDPVSFNDPTIRKFVEFQQGLEPLFDQVLVNNGHPPNDAWMRSLDDLESRAGGDEFLQSIYSTIQYLAHLQRGENDRLPPLLKKATCLWEKS